ncbi:MAG: hypothetical protein RLZZ326_486 [Planctomycetota bacterium]|jgi:hypothetical protein
MNGNKKIESSCTTSFAQHQQNTKADNATVPFQEF